MRYFPERRFEWSEPATARVARAAVSATRNRGWRGPLTVVVCAALAMVLWPLARLDTQRHEPGLSVAVPLALSLGLIVVYVPAWAERRFKTRLRIFDDRIVMIGGSGNKNVAFSSLESFAIQTFADHYALILRRRNAGEWIFGIPRDFDVAALADFFAARGLVRASAPHEPVSRHSPIVGTSLDVPPSAH